MPPSDADLRAIVANTVQTSPPLCPELTLRLITPGSRLFRATEADAERAGLPWPFWAFAWPGGQAVARYLLDHPAQVEGKSVLDFGAGCGIGAIAAALAGARRVLAADIDPRAVAAIAVNAELNGVALETTERDLIGDTVDEWDLILAGDMYYDAEESRRTSGWLHAAARRGVRGWIGDPARGFFDEAGTRALATYQAPADNDADGTRRVATTVYELQGWHP